MTHWYTRAPKLKIFFSPIFSSDIFLICPTQVLKESSLSSLVKTSLSLSGSRTERLISLFLLSIEVSKMGLAKAQIGLVPWDPDSPEHVERLYQQRIACGWNKQAVEGWRVLQRAGKIALQWVVSPLFEVSRDKQLILLRFSPNPTPQSPPSSQSTPVPGQLNPHPY